MSGGNTGSALARLSSPSLIAAITGAVSAGLSAAIKVLLLHGGVFAIVLGAIAVWTASSGIGWRWMVMVGTVYTCHIAIVPIVLFLGSVVATGSAVERLGVGRALFAAAARRAEALDPTLREKNDFNAMVQAVTAGLDAIERDPASWSAPTAGRMGSFARCGRRLALRIVRFGARAIVRELGLAPRPDGQVDFATIDEWMGSHVDTAASMAIRQPALRWLAIVLGLQLVITLLLVIVLA